MRASAVKRSRSVARTPSFDVIESDGLGGQHDASHHRAISILQRTVSARSQLSLGTATDGEDAGRAAIRLQRFVRTHFAFKKAPNYQIRLHCRHLAERLLYEDEIYRGTFRLLNQALILALMLVALSLCATSSVRLGIRTNLRSTLDLDALLMITQRDEFEASLQSLGRQAKRYFPLSSRRFDVGERGDKQLIGSFRSFVAPSLLSDMDVECLPTFSISAWVQTAEEFQQGYVVRKSATISGQGSELACWSLFLHRWRGPELHFGVHDDLSARHLQVGLEAPRPIAAGEFRLWTITINDTVVDFYQDLEHLGRRTLPRPVTDCHNGGNGVFVGDAGMQLGQLRTHVTVLSRNNIQEIFELGSTLAAISSGSQPAIVERSELDRLRAGVTESAAEAASNVVDMKEAAELNSVIQQVQAEQRGTQASYASSNLATGNIESESYNSGTHTLKTDAHTGRQYYQLLTGPGRLSDALDADARYLVQVPTFVGTGATLSWWHRHFECGSSNCGLYLMHAFDESGIPEHSFCWSIWLETDALWYDNLKGNPKYQYPKFTAEGLQDKYKFRGDRWWRHMSFVFDEAVDMIRFYIDGTLVIQKPWGSAVAQADCNGPGKRLALGHSHPGNTYPGQVEVFDLRLYVHSVDAPARPLTSADVFKIAMADTPALAAAYKCRAISEVIDTTWQDDFGHTCDWYNRKRRTHPAVCLLQAAQRNCPLACAAVQECAVEEDDVPSFRIWDRVRRLEPMMPNASLCLGSGRPRACVAGDCDLSAEQGLSRASVHARCRAWQGRGGLASEKARVVENWLESISVGREGTRLNLTQACDRVAEAVDEHCAFNLSAVQEFTRLSRRNNGDMTLAFWVKPLGDASLVNGRFFPQLTLFSSLYPPQHTLTQGIWFNPNGEFRVGSACRPLTSRWPFENVEMLRASESAWSFFAISIRNMTNTTQTKITVFTNLGKKSELSNFPVCFFNEDALFEAIEYNYAVLMSPLVMIPVALPDAKIQSMFYESFYEMPARTGPRLQQRERIHEAILREKLDYAPKSALVATPVIFQKRKQNAGSGCDVGYSSKWARSQQRKAMEEVCASPYLCPDMSWDSSDGGAGGVGDSTSDGAHVVSCPGSTPWNTSFFGVKSAEFLDGNGFVDFLFSLTDNSFLFRADSGGSSGNATSGPIRRTSDFIDSFTDSVRVILVFYTPQYGISTNVMITAKFHGSQGASVMYEVLHYEIVEGVKLWLYVLVQGLVFLNLVAMLFEVVSTLRTIYIESQLGIPISKQKLVTPFLDLMAFVLILVYVCLRVVDKLSSASTTESIISDLDAIEWGSPQVTLTSKKKRFLRAVERLYSLCLEESRIDILCNVILLVNLFRVIQCTSMHPRLNLLLGTLKHAMNDLWHALILIGLLMAFFAGIGNWRFGSSRQDFSSFMAAMGTEFQMMFGEFPVEWNATAELQMFIIIYFIVIFVFVLNFLLAIIVEAYMKLREEIMGRQTSKDFVSDLFLVAYTSRMRYRYSWPDPEGLGSLLSLWKARCSIGYADLVRTGLFGGHDLDFLNSRVLRRFFSPCAGTPCSESESVVTFLTYYSKYKFLQPPEIGKYGIKDAVIGMASTPSHVKALAFSKTDAEMLPLKEELNSAFRVVANRRSGAGDVTSQQGTRRSEKAASESPGVACSPLHGHVYGEPTLPGAVPHKDAGLDDLIHELDLDQVGRTNGYTVSGSEFGQQCPGRLDVRQQAVGQSAVTPFCAQQARLTETLQAPKGGILSSGQDEPNGTEPEAETGSSGNAGGVHDCDERMMKLKIALARAEAERCKWAYLARKAGVS